MYLAGEHQAVPWHDARTFFQGFDRGGGGCVSRHWELEELWLEGSPGGMVWGHGGEKTTHVGLLEGICIRVGLLGPQLEVGLRGRVAIIVVTNSYFIWMSLFLFFWRNWYFLLIYSNFCANKMMFKGRKRMFYELPILLICRDLNKLSIKH